MYAAIRPTHHAVARPAPSGCAAFAFAHVLIGKPVSTFPGHALCMMEQFPPAASRSSVRPPDLLLHCGPCRSVRRDAGGADHGAELLVVALEQLAIVGAVAELDGLAHGRHAPLHVG